MSGVREIEEAIRKLSQSELGTLRQWFAEFDAGVWDRKFEADAGGGRLDKLADEALNDLREGRCTDL
jgi:hypothetical protein